MRCSLHKHEYGDSRRYGSKRSDDHAVHVPGQRKIIQMNPFSPFFRTSWLAARQWWQFIHRLITADIADEGQVGILQNPLYKFGYRRIIDTEEDRLIL